MKNINVAIDMGPQVNGHSIRGIGFHTKKLIEHLKKDKELSISEVDLAKDTKKYDIYHYPSFNPYFLSLPLKKKGKTVVTIHDLIYLIYSDKYPSGLKGRAVFEVQRRLIKKVDAIITISETSKKDICRFLKIDPKKVHVIYPAAGEDFQKIEDREKLNNVKNKYHLPEKFVLYLGDVNYNKNLMVLADACKLANISLVIVGKQAADENVNLNHPENIPFREFLRKYSKDKSISRIGYVSDEELPVIFSLAFVYCQPSLYEGFGLPVIQSFSCGLPVVISKTQALVEIADDAALIADPNNTKDISEKLLKVINNTELRRTLIEKGYKRAKDFSWEKCARETLDVYRRIAEK
jgi:glycosyltransferase involved in cell wall biosynthesis